MALEISFDEGGFPQHSNLIKNFEAAAGPIFSEAHKPGLDNKPEAYQTAMNTPSNSTPSSLQGLSVYDPATATKVQDWKASHSGGSTASIGVSGKVLFAPGS